MLGTIGGLHANERMTRSSGRRLRGLESAPFGMRRMLNRRKTSLAAPHAHEPTRRRTNHSSGDRHSRNPRCQKTGLAVLPSRSDTTDLGADAQDDDQQSATASRWLPLSVINATTSRRVSPRPLLVPRSHLTSSKPGAEGCWNRTTAAARAPAAMRSARATPDRPTRRQGTGPARSPRRQSTRERRVA